MSGHFSALLQAQAQPSGPRVPVSVLTGFLGSGKTTLLNRLLSSADLAGTAVIVNEFGETGNLVIARLRSDRMSGFIQ